MSDASTPSASSTMSAVRAPVRGRRRLNRGSELVRERLIEGAIGAFAAHGFEGASTRVIAESADAHQSQINYHFESKDELWRRSMETLLAELDVTIGNQLEALNSRDPRVVFEASVRGLVEFAAGRPELSRIMMHESTAPNPRLTWLVQTHIESRFRGLRDLWAQLCESGQANPVDIDLLYHLVIGAASLMYANAPEAELLGIETSGPEVARRHGDALVAMLLKPAPEGTT